MAKQQPTKPSAVTLTDLLAQAEGYGLTRQQVVLAARHYTEAQSLDELSPEQLAMLSERMAERYADGSAPPPASPAPGRHFTLAEMAAELGREAGLRRSVYPKLIKRGQLKAEDAERQLAAMNAAYYTMKALAELGEGWRVPIERVEAAP